MIANRPLLSINHTTSTRYLPEPGRAFFVTEELNQVGYRWRISHSRSCKNGTKEFENTRWLDVRLVGNNANRIIRNGADCCLSDNLVENKVNESCGLFRVKAQLRRQVIESRGRRARKQAGGTVKNIRKAFRVLLENRHSATHGFAFFVEQGLTAGFQHPLRQLLGENVIVGCT